MIKSIYFGYIYIYIFILTSIGGIMKFSKQRELILNAVRESTAHPTADFIYEYLKKDNPNLSLGTVYRNLSQLSKHGLIRKVSIPGYPDRFDSTLSEHSHMICDKCGDIYDIESSLLKNIPSAISDELDIKITSYNISFHGVCKKCNSN